MEPYLLVWFHRPLKRHPARFGVFPEKFGQKTALFVGLESANHHEFSGGAIWACSRCSATSLALTLSITSSKLQDFL